MKITFGGVRGSYRVAANYCVWGHSSDQHTIEIAREATMLPIGEIADDLKIPKQYQYSIGHHICKIDQKYIENLPDSTTVSPQVGPATGPRATTTHHTRADLHQFKAAVVLEAADTSL